MCYTGILTYFTDTAVIIVISFDIFKYTFLACMNRLSSILEFIFKPLIVFWLHGLKAIIDFFVVRLKIYDFVKSLKLYLRQYLYSKLIYKSGKTAWVWSNYSAVLPQSSFEREVLRAAPVPMAWVWSYYRPYLGFIGNNKDIDAETQVFRPSFIHKAKSNTQKKACSNKSQKLPGRLPLMIFGAIIAIVII